MSMIWIGALAILVLLALLAWRLPVAIALVLVSFVGLWTSFGWAPAWGTLKSAPFEFAASWTLSSVPMFLLMGYVSYHAGITTGLFNLAKALFGRLPGSLAISSTLACTGFAAMCGSSIATAAAMGRIAIPEMVKVGYNRNFACGAIAAGGTIGALIPPSIIMIVYGVFAQVSIIRLFLAGIGIGLATAASYILVILIGAWLRPGSVPRQLDPSFVPQLKPALLETAPILLILAGVFGGLFGGIFTATEAGAVGALLSLIYAAGKRVLTREILLRSLADTITTCGSIFLIGVGATMLTRLLSLTGLGSQISALVDGLELSYWQLMAIIVLIYLILGMFLDAFGAMLITLPIFTPILHAYGIDMVFFGVFLVKMLEIGMITPPVGMNVYVIKGVVGNLTTLNGVFRGILPFLFADMVVIVLLISFPTIMVLG
ncbi:TRAP transporter large permease [Rhodobacter sp. NTK016B]|uniref:TRAP transporter large permease n=1 Tax=Rhodobacter sp. NTK016B TaxID=2759676 RepID=UPI001A8C7FCF|nr:TRAP transporter large permease [Rhodobacter sp. NTK016B]MBN8292450.1 TRAP transporter large permease [Rhodobacter sp. NTK016B]